MAFFDNACDGLQVVLNVLLAGFKNNHVLPLSLFSFYLKNW